MKIGIISDTHGFVHPELFTFFEKCDEIWHAGDIGSMDVLTELQLIAPVRAVYGNCDDWEVREHTTESLVFNCEQHKVAIMHIVGNGNYYSTPALQLIEKEHPTIFIAGHSHILKVMNDQKHHLMFMNPGSASRFGHHTRLTFMRMDITGNQLSNLEIYDEPKMTGSCM
ncbi:MAG: metallophosphoesterase family protein [Bacteroidales bacterium]|nr:metallophosphoesterase family protein [Bacteroidales bacterium]MDD6582528.1 metallophosphoesterase family protein [Bacteroidales bacterium]